MITRQNYDDHDYSTENLEESEFGQLQAMHLSMNAVSAVRARLETQALKESLTECEECGDEIPLARQLAIKGVTKCVHCQSLSERR